LAALAFCRAFFARTLVGVELGVEPQHLDRLRLVAPHLDDRQKVDHPLGREQLVAQLIFEIFA
jgi:hypothetical protein